MTIKTLEYIHNLLIQAEKEAGDTYAAARNLEHEYERNGAYDDLVESQRDAADEFMREHLKAIAALQDFEDHDWN